MSGAEAIAVFSVIANIIALTNFTRDVVSQIKEYSENAHQVPKAFRDIQAVLPLISTTLVATRDKVGSGVIDDDSCKVLRPVLEGCENKLKQLKIIFNGVMAEKGASKFKRGLIAIKSMRKDKEVKEIARALDNFVVHLTHYHASEGVSTKDIESLRCAMVSMSVKEPETQSPEAHYLVPVQWSDDFAGREEVMEFLDQKLCLDDRHSRVALVGLGGMGKTRIALEYAKKFEKSNQISVFWVYAGTVERFKNAYREIARKLEIPGYQNSESDILCLVKDWLEDGRPGQWLMILDNADDAEIMYGSGSSRLTDCLPKSDQGSILLTTRFRKVGASFTTTRNTIDLQQMTLEESESLLRARLGDESLGQDHHLYQELAEELERTPLALVQAASFMSQNCIPLDIYLRMYRESDVSKIRLLGENFEDDIRDSEAKNPIATTWIISFDYIRIHVPQAAELLSLMSILDAQNIPDFLLPQGEDAISFNKAIGTLKAFSFITTKKQSPGPLQPYRLFDLHRLVRLAVRNWLKVNNTLNQRTAQVLKILGSTCSEDDSEKFEISSLILQHVIEILASDLLQFRRPLSCTYEFESSDTPSLSELHSISATASTQFRETAHLLESVDTISNLMIHTAQLLEYVTSRFRDVNNLLEAKGFGTKCVAISARARGQSHASTLRRMSLLASILQDLNEIEHAEQLLRRIVTSCESEYGFQHPLTLDYLLDLKKFLTRRDSEQEAKQIVEVAIQRCQESLKVHEGEESFRLLLLLAELRLEIGDFQEAEKSALLALHGYEAANNDFEVLISLGRLSEIYTIQGKKALAVNTRRNELDMRIKVYGQNHASTMYGRWELTRLCLIDGRIEEARQQASLALELIGQIYDSSSDTYAYHHREFDEIFSERGELLSLQEQFDPQDTTDANISASYVS